MKTRRGAGRASPSISRKSPGGPRGSLLSSAQGQQAKAAGLLHDLGKYADQFQRRLKDPGREPSRDHWTAGAALLLQCYKGLGMLPSLAVGGHHAGLTVLEPDQKEYLKSLAHTLGDANVVTDSNVGRLRDRFGDDGLTFPGVEAGLESAGNSADDMLDARMLFSALVDADFIETEAHFEGDDQQPRRYRPEGPALEPKKGAGRATSLRPPPPARSEVLRRRVATSVQNSQEKFLQSPFGRHDNAARRRLAI